MAITATLSAENPAEIRSRNMKIVQGKMTLSSTYVTGGFSVAGIDPKLAYLVALGGAYVWQYLPATKKLKAMKMDDKIASAGDGRLIEASNGATLTDVIYYFGFVTAQ